jgi:hypothetical protein
MKTVFFNILLLFVLNSFSKATYNDTIATKLHGQGCGIIPNSEEVDYNITLLEKLQKTDSNNVLIYKHLAMQYYILWSREKNELLKEDYRQKSIRNNLKVIEFIKLNNSEKYLKSSIINNLLVLFCFGKDCQNTKKYFALLKKREIKSMDNTTITFVKKYCNIE